MEGGGYGGPSAPVNNNRNGEEDDDGLAGVLELPPGFRFHPTDEEIIMHYLLKKVMDRRFVARAIGEADLNKCEPWDLPKKAKMGEKEWFFFCQRDRKYPTGMRTNRATESGYWKATGKDKEIYRARNWLVGMKKTLVFYKGRAPKGEKTNWVMHEYRLEGNLSNYNFSRAAKEEFVVSRVFHKSTGIRKSPSTSGGELARFDPFDVDHHLLDSPTLPPLIDYNCSNQRPSSSLATYNNNNNNHGNIEADDSKGNVITTTSSSRLFLNNHNLQMPYDPKNFLLPPQNYPSYPFPGAHNSQIALPTSMFPYQAPPPSSSSSYHNQDGLMIRGFPSNVFPFKGGAHDHDQANLMLMATKMEHFSSNNSVISHSQDTGLSTENVATETTSVHSKGDVESKKPFDQELDGLSFSPDISDLDSLWSFNP